MNNEMVIKTYDIDYSFIIKNYLDKSLWHVEWNLLVYKDFIFTISLRQIDVYDESIAFRISCKYIENNEHCSYSTIIWYNIGNGNINVLKRQINGAIKDVIESVERTFIRNTDEYYRAQQLEELENEKLIDYAKEFLDDEGVSNSEIRDAYIEYYVDKNSNYDYTKQIIDEYQYLLLFDLFLTFYQIENDEDNIKRIEEKYENSFGKDELNRIKQEIEENLEYIESEEYEKDMKNCLESL